MSTRCPVLQLDSPVDYRRGARSSTFQSNELESSKSWFVLPKEKAEFEEIISKITKNDRGTESSITVYGRKVRIPWATKNVARFTFDQLCRSELGPADYVSLTSKFSTIVVDNAPILLIHQKNEARRLITLLDALCEYISIISICLRLKSHSQMRQNAACCARHKHLSMISSSQMP